MDPKKGHGDAKPSLWNVPPGALYEIAKAMDHGARKYGRYNWRKTGVVMSTYLKAVQRHLDLCRDGEDVSSDTDPAVLHLAHIAASCIVAIDARLCGKLEDDRDAGPVNTAALLIEPKKGA